MQVLVADDDITIQRLLDKTLHRWGHDAICVNDGDEAQRRLIDPHAPQLAIIDYEMPGMDGLDVCRAVRKARDGANLFIFMLTACDDAQTLSDALAAGADDFLTKPFNPVELKARLGAAVRRIQTLSNAMAIAADTSPDEVGFCELEQHDGSRLMVPQYDPRKMQFKMGVPQQLLKSMELAGELSQFLIDRVQLCPKCEGLPTFRAGCRHCTSGRIFNDRLIHHFACAHVGPADEFGDDASDDVGLRCPKCRVRRLLVGSDYEYLNGLYRCHDCNHADSDLEQIGHCLRCGHRFIARDSYVQDVTGYRAPPNVQPCFVASTAPGVAEAPCERITEHVVA